MEEVVEKKIVALNAPNSELCVRHFLLYVPFVCLLDRCNYCAEICNRRASLVKTPVFLIQSRYKCNIYFLSLFQNRG